MTEDGPSWERSAAAWADGVERDLNRTELLDALMLRLCGGVHGKRVLDVGCGEGRFCRRLAARGAVTTGLDPTAPLLATARSLHPEGEYVQGMAEAMPFDDGHFDLVVSYLTLIDIAGYREAIADMARVLAPGGRLLIANLQSFVTTRENPWHRDPASGEKLHIAVDDYFTEQEQRATWQGPGGLIDIPNHHRPLGAYMTALLSAGLTLEAFEEPMPTEDAVARHPKLASQRRVPWFVVMAWRKH